jgi:hypothetical protein
MPPSIKCLCLAGETNTYATDPVHRESHLFFIPKVNGKLQQQGEEKELPFFARQNKRSSHYSMYFM